MKTSNNFWQEYKELELMSEDIPEPQPIISPLAKRLSQLWRSIADRRAGQIPSAKQVEHLEHCLTLYQTRVSRSTKAGFGRKLWTLLNQPLFEMNNSLLPEPEVRQVRDQQGHLWWYAHDPLTNQTAYLESEEEVHIWLEERLHHYP